MAVGSNIQSTKIALPSVMVSFVDVLGDQLHEDDKDQSFEVQKSPDHDGRSCQYSGPVCWLIDLSPPAPCSRAKSRPGMTALLKRKRLRVLHSAVRKRKFRMLVCEDCMSVLRSCHG